jgi:prepilin-type N-terminal cleavage/methylation domain-containing protein
MNGNFFSTAAKRQKGFTMVELIIVVSVIALLSLLGIPFVRDFIVEGKVQPTGNDLNKIVTKIRANASGSGAAPYLVLGAPAAATAVFANTARGLAVSMTVAGAGATATVQHDIGAAGSLIGVAQGNLGAAGDSFVVTFPTVNKAACPGLATQVSRTAEVIAINGTVVKANGGQYNGATAQNVCTAADTNTFAFTFR